MDQRAHFKDEILDRLAQSHNVAQFVSFDPQGRQRFTWMAGHEPNAAFATLEVAVETLLRRSPEGSVNVRSFEPYDAKSRDFVYGLRTTAEAVGTIRNLTERGLFTIVNETIDVNDGGVSGVAFGDLVEFAPGDTPRCVEKPGTAAFPRDAAFRLFRTVYGFDAALPQNPRLRVEFSLHPVRRGHHHDHTIVWEVEEQDTIPEAVQPTWPNLFSRALGDKTFGLLVAWLNGASVPRTLAISRRLAPFQFGDPTGSHEPWIRTCPIEQVPGRFTTARGWRDPFDLLRQEDPDGQAIACVLAQEGVDAVASGATITQRDGAMLVEGVHGAGDTFMVGHRAPEALSAETSTRVAAAYHSLHSQLGPIRFEWVDDGRRLWIVQLHRGSTVSQGSVIYPGTADRYHRFATVDGLEALRALIARVRDAGGGITLVGQVGVTSHFGDVLRKAQIPSFIETPEN